MFASYRTERARHLLPVPRAHVVTPPVIRITRRTPEPDKGDAGGRGLETHIMRVYKWEGNTRLAHLPFTYTRRQIKAGHSYCGKLERVTRLRFWP